ncbi:lipid A biosynthesis lauroyl acyltransferase [mine drainage metagenome]|uniref:Lipid A biosynthesis lauroyl acyltransferase n=1 Tax=mine drainage metagenome TaxID=410659 RepID=A0A1J5S9N7_9ZZZZ
MYYLVYSIFYLLSLIPWWIMYRISDGIYFLIYYVFGYRKEVVLNNLLIAFPDKTEKERIRIAKDFYHQFVDTFLEIIKLISISEKELNKRFVCNYEVMNDLFDSGKNVQLHAGHFFNWEFWNLAYSANSLYPLIGVYIPLSNKVMDKIIYKMRSRFGTILIAADKFRTQFHNHQNKRYALALGADQNPGNPKASYWLTFFGKMTPFITGPERGSFSANPAIIFSNFYPVKRGYYKSELTLITTEPNTLQKGELTKLYRDFLEEQIKLRPSNYLWSHRRWKFEFDESKYGNLVV